MSNDQKYKPNELPSTITKRLYVSYVVGGYFAGRRYGKTKLGALSSAAGIASPNKTVEGVIGGCVFSVFLSTLGAWVQKWP